MPEEKQDAANWGAELGARVLAAEDLMADTPRLRAEAANAPCGAREDGKAMDAAAESVAREVLVELLKTHSIRMIEAPGSADARSSASEVTVTLSSRAARQTLHLLVVRQNELADSKTHGRADDCWFCRTEREAIAQIRAALAEQLPENTAR